MPLEALRDICIIDTPGMNDPVQSREERTVELLKTCDVVFIVSPAGQFLNAQDIEVMGRITQKKAFRSWSLSPARSIPNYTAAACTLERCARIHPHPAVGTGTEHPDRPKAKQP